jgi:hypothetical protein
LDTADASRRRQVAIHLASATQRRLKDIPALVLLQSEAVTAETTRFFTHVLPHLGNIAGRRYVLWALFYLGASLCFDPRFPERSWAYLKELLGIMTRQWEQWTTKEQRVIVCGLELLARKGAEAGLAGENPLWVELRRWAYTFLEKPRLQAGWRWSFRVQEFLRTLAEVDVLPANDVYILLRQHQERGRFLEEIVRGLAQAFWEEPSVVRWQQVESLFSGIPKASDQLKSWLCMRLEETTPPAFWRFTEEIGRQGGPPYVHWLRHFLGALENLEPERLADETRSHVVAFLKQALAGEPKQSWMRESIRRLLERYAS